MTQLTEDEKHQAACTYANERFEQHNAWRLTRKMKPLNTGEDVFWVMQYEAFKAGLNYEKKSDSDRKPG